MLLPTEQVLELCAAPRREAAFELVFDSEVLELIHESSLALDTPISGSAALWIMPEMWSGWGLSRGRLEGARYRYWA